MMTYIRAWMSLKFFQIQPGTSELGRPEESKKINFATFYQLLFCLIHFEHLQTIVFDPYLDNHLSESFHPWTRGTL